jgi:predicted ATPase/class 3 adenylate cyclase
MMEVVEPPVGTIALLFTDVEGSTRLAARLGTLWPDVLAEHHALVSAAIAEEDGYVDGTEGDAFFATFADPAAAARAAVNALRALRAHTWPEDVGELRVRMGLHVGYVERASTGYVGLEVHRAARVASAAHGGQLLLTAAARELIGNAVPTDGLGAHRLKDFPAPEVLFCAIVDGRGADAFPPPRTEVVRPTNLPAGTPVLVGRDADVERVCDALVVEGERVVTVTGRGGAGKTSLALVAAAKLLDQYPGGVWLVELATLALPGEMLGAIAAAVGADRDVASPSLQVLENRLRGAGPTLLVLDNMEHILAATEELDELLDRLPSVRLLVTSQAPLRIGAERVIVLDTLDDAAALDLIWRVARRRGVELLASAADEAVLRDVVGLLDGLPLGLELAAARLSVLTPQQLRDRLQVSPDLLKDAGAKRPERHRSLRALLVWTLDLLDDAPRSLFRRIGAFAGAVELEEIETVAGGDGLDVFESLAALVDVALVRRVESGDGRVRFGLPEALRQIASRMLDEAVDGPAWRRAHAQRQLDLVWAARTTFAVEPVYRAALAADAEAAAALRWARANDGDLAARLGAACAMVLVTIGRLREAVSLLDPILEALPPDPVVQSLALAAHATALLAVGDSKGALPVAHEAVRRAAEPTGVFLALITRALVRTFLGEHVAAVADNARATALARDLDPAALSGALVLEAQARMAAGELNEAQARLSEAERTGEPVDASSMRFLDTLRGDLATASGRPADALEPYARSLELAQARGDALQVLFDLRGLANAVALIGRDADALELLGIAEMQATEIGPSGAVGEHLQGAEPVVAAHERAGTAAAADLTGRGRAVPSGYRVTRACQLARRPAAA